ncbi:MAG TPA: tRNA (adenosine(37)-N6)-threonylcarbamoyltransferase complex dimerization subunit type 1 TsaB [Anaerolineales bacterium]|nr:tRNA (adenosine(37)-N6)-threonylcarbamoyltransferase complex dimerization subunit type 1 TsaB [Anaerolineales bacterium]
MLLAVDTSTAQVGVAIHDGAQVLGESVWRSKQHHTVELAPAVAELLGRCGLTMKDMRALGVALGPGSFTSLRVGLSLVKGLALALDLPLIGIPTLDIYAAAQPASKLPLLAAIRAGRGRLAVVWYKSVKQGWQSKGPARVVPVESLIYEIRIPSIVCGELSAEDRQRLARDEVNVNLLPPSQCVRRPSILAELAWARWQEGEVDDEASLAPIYLHTTEPVAA